MSQPTGIAILGCGAVGSSVARILSENGSALNLRTNRTLELRHVIVRDLSKDRSVDLAGGILSDNPQDAINDPDTHIIVELIGGEDTAFDLAMAALKAGKNLVTANKAMLSAKGRELFATARSLDRCIAFEAAVGGGIPLIESIRRGLIANEIDAVFGILNGTCNFILTRMLESKIDYADALQEAQRLGYAEADPTLDVDGTDSAHKLTILASIAMRQNCTIDQVFVRGITDIEITDLAAGEELGFVCKLLAIATHHEDGLDLSVQPTFIRKTHPLASVSGPFNAVSVYGDAVGHTLYYGRGAGGMPTASAVVADIVEVATGITDRVFSQLAVLPDVTIEADVRSPGENRLPFYVRVGLEDRPGGMAAIAHVLGDEGISIASLVQHDPHETHAGDSVPAVVTTHPALGRSVDAAVKKMNALDGVRGRVVCIPILDEHTESHSD